MKQKDFGGTHLLKSKYINGMPESFMRAYIIFICEELTAFSVSLNHAFQLDLHRFVMSNGRMWNLRHLRQRA
jgi:hypothetical protein